MSASSSGTSQFFIPDSRITFINKVMAGVQAKKIVALEGPEGIGKTALLEEVLTTALPDANKCYLTCTPSMNDIQVRSRIIEQLFGNVLFDPEMPLLTSFIEFNHPSEILIAIDNCHYLSGRLIGELLQLFSESDTLGIKLSMVLAFNRKIASTLLNVNSGFLQVFSIPALNKQESYQLMAEYIPDLAAQTNIKVKRWIENSSGIPIQLLAFNEDSPIENPDASPLNLKFWGALLVMASLLLTLGIYEYRINVTPQATKQELTANPSAPILKQQVVQPWKQDGVDKSAANAATESSVNRTESKDLPTAESQTSSQQDFRLDERPMARMTATPAASSEVIFDALMTTKDAVQKETSEPQVVRNKSKDVPKNPTTDMILAELTAEKQQREQAALAQTPLETTTPQKVVEADKTLVTTTEVAASVDDSSMLDVFLEAGDKATEGSLPAALPKDENSSEADLSSDGIISTPNETQFELPSGVPYQIDNQQFMALPAAQFVLQLTAVSSHEVLAEYLQSAPVSADKLRIYKVRRNQTDWIVVTHGLFASIEQARAEANLIAPNAWAKSISVIQQQITAYQNTQTNN